MSEQVEDPNVHLRLLGAGTPEMGAGAERSTEAMQAEEFIAFADKGFPVRAGNGSRPEFSSLSWPSHHLGDGIETSTLGITLIPEMEKILENFFNGGMDQIFLNLIQSPPHLTNEEQFTWSRNMLTFELDTLEVSLQALNHGGFSREGVSPTIYLRYRAIKDALGFLESNGVVDNIIAADLKLGREIRIARGLMYKLEKWIWR